MILLFFFLSAYVSVSAQRRQIKAICGKGKREGMTFYGAFLSVCYCFVLIRSGLSWLDAFKVFIMQTEADVRVMLSVLLWHASFYSCELFTSSSRHFSDDNLMSEIVFCFIKDNFLLLSVCAPFLYCFFAQYTEYCKLYKMLKFKPWIVGVSVFSVAYSLPSNTV